MKIEFKIDYRCCANPILVTVTNPHNDVVLDLSQCKKTLMLDMTLPIQKQIIQVTFNCDDITIVDHPVTINDILLDDFYRFDRVLYSGTPEFDQKFLDYASSRQMSLDPAVNDSNRLDFTGRLIYKFVWPFYHNIFS